MSQSTTTSSESRALTLLGQGYSPEITANAVGISVSRVSQLLSDEKFAAQVAELRFASLVGHNDRDQKYDQMEDRLIERMKDCLPLMFKPMEILKAISVINAAKRRGVAAPETAHQQQTVVNITIPTQVYQQFVTNVNNQVVKVGEQDMVTVQSSSLNSLVEKLREKRNGLLTNTPSSNDTFSTKEAIGVSG